MDHYVTVRSDHHGTAILLKKKKKIKPLSQLTYIFAVQKLLMKLLRELGPIK